MTTQATVWGLVLVTLCGGAAGLPSRLAASAAMTPPRPAAQGIWQQSTRLGTEAGERSVLQRGGRCQAWSPSAGTRESRSRPGPAMHIHTLTLDVSRCVLSEAKGRRDRERRPDPLPQGIGRLWLGHVAGTLIALHCAPIVNPRGVSEVLSKFPLWLCQEVFCRLTFHWWVFCRSKMPSLGSGASLWVPVAGLTALIAFGQISDRLRSQTNQWTKTTSVIPTSFFCSCCNVLSNSVTHKCTLHANPGHTGKGQDGLSLLCDEPGGVGGVGYSALEDRTRSVSSTSNIRAVHSDYIRHIQG